MTLALGKMEAAAAETLPSHWAAMAEATRAVAPRMTAQATAMTLNALCRVEAAAAEMSPDGWRALTRRGLAGSVFICFD